MHGDGETCAEAETRGVALRADVRGVVLSPYDVTSNAEDWWLAD
jgi:hypothetical protein